MLQGKGWAQAAFTADWVHLERSWCLLRDFYLLVSIAGGLRLGLAWICLSVNLG